MHRISNELRAFSKPSFKETAKQAGTVLIISVATSGVIALLDFGVTALVNVFI